MARAFNGMAESLQRFDEAGQDFEFRLWLPRCKFLEKPLQVSDGKWIEAGNIIALKDATNDYATAIAQVRNEQQYYLDDV